MVSLNFDSYHAKVISNQQPSVVYFSASWCKPCQGFSPRLEKALSKIVDPVSVYKVDVEEEAVLAETMGVQSLPTTLIIKNGKEVARLAGAVASDITLHEFLSKVK
jgi:thioredoxin